MHKNKYCNDLGDIGYYKRTSNALDDIGKTIRRTSNALRYKGTSIRGTSNALGDRQIMLWRKELLA